ncbi:uncharacterized mitochondrial protein AtMg00860-like [Vigna umbellata]|uniref:uncharacterized mitochondrial protein AtMg00860-like n=1 Tax=Vigna umbellata TaxID=87088 RepID=UPI001F5E7531|nr:uncharacterized mitochondrial protein AtMg00860-like [Vigna umbellata]
MGGEDIQKTAFRTHQGHYKFLWVVNHKKSEFGRTHIRYLGHIISEKGVEMDGEKVEAIIGWEEPKTIKVLRGFLGLTGYYRRFVRNYVKIARPLTDLLKKGNFAWTNLAREAMEKLKVAIMTALVLALPDFSIARLHPTFSC